MTEKGGTDWNERVRLKMEKGTIKFNEPMIAKVQRELDRMERVGQIENFEHLLETLESGDVETACIWLRAAIRRLSA